MIVMADSSRADFAREVQNLLTYHGGRLEDVLRETSEFLRRVGCDIDDEVKQVEELRNLVERELAGRSAEKLYDSRDDDDFPWMEVVEVGHGKIVLQSANHDKITIETRERELEQEFAKRLYKMVHVHVESDPKYDDEPEDSK